MLRWNAVGTASCRSANPAPTSELEHGERKQRQGHGQAGEQQPGRRHDELAPRPGAAHAKAEGEEAADHGADRLDREDRAPRRRAAEVVLRDDRPEHVQRREVGQLEQAERGDDGDGPRAAGRARGSRLEVASTDAVTVRATGADRSRRDECRGGEERHGVDGDRERGASRATMSAPIAGQAIEKRCSTGGAGRCPAGAARR